MNVLVIDVGGTHVKVLATGEKAERKFVSGPDLTSKRPAAAAKAPLAERKFVSGPDLTPAKMVGAVKAITSDWKYDVVSIGYPGPVLHDKPVAEPHNLACGWVGFDFEKAFGRPVKLINDAAMQALGSYHDGKMLFLGLGTGLGSAMIADGIIEPMELSHLPYKKGTYEDYVGERGLEHAGKKKWRRHVEDVVERLKAALEPDDVVIGGGNVRLLKEMPTGCRVGDNANAFAGGFRLWADAKTSPAQKKIHRGRKLVKKAKG